MENHSTKLPYTNVSFYKLRNDIQPPLSVLSSLFYIHCKTKHAPKEGRRSTYNHHRFYDHTDSVSSDLQKTGGGRSERSWQASAFVCF